MATQDSESYQNKGRASFKSHIVAMVIAALPFVYVGAPPAVSNVAGFVFWVSWIIGLLAVLASLAGWVYPKSERNSLPVRICYRLATCISILMLAALGLYAMAAIMVIVLVLNWVRNSADGDACERDQEVAK